MDPCANGKWSLMILTVQKISKSLYTLIEKSIKVLLFECCDNRPFGHGVET